MLLHQEVKTFVEKTFIEEVLKQLQTNFNENVGIISLCLKIDLSRVLRKQNTIGVFIVSNYCKFVQISEETILEILKTKKIISSEVNLNLSFHLQNCPLPRHNLQSSEFLRAAYENPTGLVVYIKEAQIIRIKQPELYLYSWNETWISQCNCGISSLQQIHKQKLLQILHNTDINLKTIVAPNIPRCKQCSTKMKKKTQQNEYYLNCQKIFLEANIKNGSMKEELFHQGIFQLYVDQDNMNKFQIGSIVDLCAHFKAQPVISKCNGLHMTLKNHYSMYMICCYDSKPAANHNLFLSNLRKIRIQQNICQGISDSQGILTSYNSLMKGINRIKFPMLQPDNFTTLKLVVLNSIFSLRNGNTIHMLAITDQVALIQKAIELVDLRVKFWPRIWDPDTLLWFFGQCHYSILIVSNPTKKDLQYINLLLQRKICTNISVSLWVITQPFATLKKDIETDLFSVVLDLTFAKNYNICSGVYEDIIDTKMNTFLCEQDDVDNCLLTLPKRKYKLNDDYISGQKLSDKDKQRQNLQAKQLLQKYYLKSRDYKKIKTSTLTVIKELAEGFSNLRNFMINACHNDEVKLGIIDAILAIFIEEETSRNKYSSSNTLFSNEISKLMLNEEECQLSFWQYDYDEENDDLGEKKQHMSKNQMFIRMVNKLQTLIYRDEIL